MTSVTSTRSARSRPAPQSRPRRTPPGGGTAASIDPFRVLRRHVWLIALMGFVGLFLGGVAWWILDVNFPLYSTSVYFEVTAGLANSNQVGTTDVGRNDVVERVAQTETSLLLENRNVLTDALKTRDVKQTAWMEEFKLGEAGTYDFDEAVDELVDELDTAVVRNSNLFTLSWSTSDKNDVAVILNSIAREYLDYRRQQDNEKYNDNRKVFEKQLDNTRASITAITADIEVFIRKHGITALDDPRFTAASTALDDVVARMGETQATYQGATGQRDMIARKIMGTVEWSAEDIKIAELRPKVAFHDGQLEALRTELRVSLEKWKPDHQIIESLERNIRANEVQRQVTLDEEVESMLSASMEQMTNIRDSAAKSLDELELQRVQLDETLRDLAANYSSYLHMEDQRSMLESMRDQDRQLIKELALLQARADAARVQVAQFGLTPRDKSFPDIRLIVPLTAVLLVGLTVAAVFVFELTDKRVKSVGDLSVVPGARVVGVIPELDEDPTKTKTADPELIVRTHPQSVLAESFRQACTPLIKVMSLSQHQSLLLIGGLPGAGTTTAATNIAACQVAAGKRVVLVDANFRRPRLARTLGVPDESIGLGDLLFGECSLDEAITSTEAGMDVISAGSASNRVFERLNDERFDSLMAQLRDRYDLILIDTPPAIVAGDAFVLANKVDATMLVVRAHQEQRGLVARLISQLSEADAELIGVLLNRARGTAGGYFKKNFATMAKYARAGES